MKIKMDETEMRLYSREYRNRNQLFKLNSCSNTVRPHSVDSRIEEGKNNHTTFLTKKRPVSLYNEEVEDNL